MKVLLATPDSGGPATDAAFMKTELPRLGIETVVISFGKVRHLPSGIRHVRYAIELLKNIRKVDAIIAFDTFSVCLPAALIARLIGTSLIVRVPGDYAWEQATQRFGVTDTIEAFQKKRYGLKVEILRTLQRLAVRQAALVVVCSDFLKKIVAEWHIAPEKLKRIYLGIDLEEKADMPSNIPEGKILLSIGRLVPWKGFSMLMRLVPELPEDWKLVIVGDGPERARLEEKARSLGISDRVLLTGAIPRKEVLGWLRSAHAFALNTYFESFSYQVLEAMVAGVPIITTSIGSIPELIENGVEGVLCTPGDSEAFLNAILSTEQDTTTWQKRTESAQQKAKRFSSHASVEMFAEELKKICA